MGRTDTPEGLLMSSDAGDRMDPPPSGRGAFGGIAWITALGVATFAWLRPTNFRGADEWLIVWMLSRGLISFPHANRPLGLVWHLPAWLVAPDQLWGFLVVHAAWLTLAGVLTFLLVRRLLPGETGVALLAGALAVTWMPSETTRIASVQMIQYSGTCVGALAASWLLVESWQRRRPILLLGALPLALAAALSLEATLPVLGAASLLLVFSRRPGDGGRLLRWVGGVGIVSALAGARVLWPLMGERAALSYQMEMMGGMRSPRGTLRQIGTQLRYHLEPLLTLPSSHMAHAATLIAVLVFAAGILLLARERSGGFGHGRFGRKGLVLAALVGLAHASLAYLPYALSRAVRGPDRTQFLAAPGIAVLVAAVVALAVSYLPARARAPVACLVGAWIVALGTSRTLAHQEQWTAGGTYEAQRSTLQQLAKLAPRVEPHSLIVLLYCRTSWPLAFTSVKAVQYLYEDDARGVAAGSVPVLYDTRFEADGVVSEPAPALRAGWGEPIERYRYDEVLAFGRDPAGRLYLFESWPEEEMGALPPGARYAPRLRIRSDQPASKRFGILDPEP